MSLHKCFSPLHPKFSSLGRPSPSQSTVVHPGNVQSNHSARWRPQGSITTSAPQARLRTCIATVVVLFSHGCSAVGSQCDRPDSHGEVRSLRTATRRCAAYGASKAVPSPVDEVQEPAGDDRASGYDSTILVGWTLVGIGALVGGVGAPVWHTSLCVDDPHPGLHSVGCPTVTALLALSGLAVVSVGSLVTVRGYSGRRREELELDRLRQDELGAPEAASSRSPSGIHVSSIESSPAALKAPVAPLGLSPWLNSQGGGLSLTLTF